MTKRISIIMICLLMALSISSINFAETTHTYSISNDPLCLFDGLEYKSIQTYTVDGYQGPFVCAENLENYGFTVIWDKLKRSTYIDFVGQTEASGYQVCPIADHGKIYDSDVKIILNGREIAAYNAGGYSLINVLDLYENHSLVFSGHFPSKWALDYVLLASYNHIFDFVDQSLDYYTTGVGGYSQHKKAIDYQEAMTIGDFYDLLKQFETVYPNQSNNQMNETISIESMLKGLSLTDRDSDLLITREEVSVMIQNFLDALNLPYNDQVDTVIFKDEDFDSATLFSAKCATLNQFLTLDSKGQFNPKDKLSLEASLVIISKIGMKYGIFNEMPSYDLTNTQSITDFNKKALTLDGSQRFDYENTDSKDFTGDIYRIDSLEKPVRLPSLKSDHIDRYLCHVSYSADNLILDYTTGIGYSRHLELDYPHFNTVLIYDGDKSAKIYSDDALVSSKNSLQYLANGICRVTMPLNGQVDKVDKILIAYPNLGYIEVDL